jgi:oxaloacetate decarboxylase (Na+ extruding) subunit alpha
LPPELAQAKKDAAEYMQQEEDVLTQAFFPKPAQTFFKRRLEKQEKLDLNLLNKEDSVYPV